MQELYRTPRNRQRFDHYLELLQGPSKKDIILPIAGFNPMAGERVLQQVNSLIELRAEELVSEVIKELSDGQVLSDNPNLKVAINIGDDLGGAWTQRYVTDYESKFKIKALLKRGFCVVFLWSSELYSTELIRRRIRAYILRYYYQSKYGSASSLADHLEQESYIYRSAKQSPPIYSNFQQTYIEEYRLSAEYTTIFNFFYGDEASLDLAYLTSGNSVGYPFYDL